MSINLFKGCHALLCVIESHVLHHASRNPGGTLEMTKALLKFGANPNVTTKGGKKPSDMAFPEARALLLAMEGNIQEGQLFGLSRQLHYSCQIDLS